MCSSDLPGGVYSQIVDTLVEREALQDGSYRVVALQPDAETVALPESATTIVTVGTGAARAVYRQQPSARVLSALITNSGFSYLATIHYGSIDQAHRRGVSAVLLDQPAQRLYRLGRLLLPDARHIGVLSGEPAAHAAELNSVTDTNGDAHIEQVVLTADIRPIGALGPVIKRSDFVIALPGKELINASAARWILQLGSKLRTPVIAYSRKYTTSGALASVYTSAGHVAREISDILRAIKEDPALPEQNYPPRQFSVSLNSRVAQALGLTLEDAEYYRRELQRLEGLE